jgi:hypothetical protein|tara:strand:+ start:43 stop:396 length:354 start_codon:yes stop_codon:yes gene_type:complete
MTVVAEKLVDNTELFINTVNGKSNEASQLVQDINALENATSEPEVSIVNVHHDIQGTGKVTLQFGDEDTLELSGRGNYGLKPEEEKKIGTKNIFVKSDNNVSMFNLVMEGQKTKGFN